MNRHDIGFKQAAMQADNTEPLWQQIILTLLFMVTVLSPWIALFLSGGAA